MEEYSEYSLYNGNPLEFGYFLDSIYIKGIKTQKKIIYLLLSSLTDSIFSFIGKVDCHSGIVSYPQPENGMLISSIVLILSAVPSHRFYF